MEYGLIGEKLGHSFSKEIHNQIGNYEYSLKEIKREDLGKFLSEKNFRGINVTIPYKEAVIPFLDWISEQALAIGAVNTIVNKNGKLYGYNTDYFGAKACLEKNGIDVKDKKVLVLGTGGTSKTLRKVLSDSGAKEVIIVSRKKGNGVADYEEAMKKHFDARIIVNTTPVGMYPNVENSPINLDVFTDLCGVADVIYNPLSTDLVLSAKKRNIATCGGLYMLVYQAVKAAELFGTTDDITIADRIYDSIYKNKKNIVLIGMPTCGKSTIGKRISKLANKRFCDIDVEITKSFGSAPSEIITSKGESFFRDIETQTVKNVSLETGTVIATGGGTVLREENVNALKRNGVIVFLNRDLDKLIPASDRPLSSNRETLRKMYDARYDKYVSAADIVIDANGTIDEVTEKIKEVF